MKNLKIKIEDDGQHAIIILSKNGKQKRIKAFCFSEAAIEKIRNRK